MTRTQERQALVEAVIQNTVLRVCGASASIPGGGPKACRYLQLRCRACTLFEDRLILSDPLSVASAGCASLDLKPSPLHEART